MRLRFAFAALIAIAALPLQAGSGMAKVLSITDGTTLVVEHRGAEMKLRMHGIVVPPADETRPVLAQLNRESVAVL